MKITIKWILTVYFIFNCQTTFGETCREIFLKETYRTEEMQTQGLFDPLRNRGAEHYFTSPVWTSEVAHDIIARLLASTQKNTQITFGVDQGMKLREDNSDLIRLTGQELRALQIFVDSVMTRLNSGLPPDRIWGIDHLHIRSDNFPPVSEFDTAGPDGMHDHLAFKRYAHLYPWLERRDTLTVSKAESGNGTVYVDNDGRIVQTPEGAVAIFAEDVRHGTPPRAPGINRLIILIEVSRIRQ